MSKRYCNHWISFGKEEGLKLASLIPMMLLFYIASLFWERHPVGTLITIGMLIIASGVVVEIFRYRNRTTSGKETT